MAKAMIISVGGTLDPLVKTLTTHRPEFVCFYCSEESVENVGEIKRLAREQGVAFRNRNVTAENAEDLVSCYSDALKAAARLEETGIAREDVVVDYTGGTKTMTAALALATVGKGYRFSYVGGKERDKGGLGVVVTGSEKVLTGVSPWWLFAVEEKKRFASLFNRHLFASAAEVLEGVARHDLPEKPLIEALTALTRGYWHWDAFRHEEGKKHLKAGVDGLTGWVQIKGDRNLQGPLKKAETNLDFLNRLQRETRGFKKRHRLQVVDLLANARRRAEVGRHDDAVARVYRALELLGQVSFEEAFGCETGKAPVKVLPESMREEYSRKYGIAEGGVLQLPLAAAFHALAVADKAEGRQFAERADDFKKLLYSRNHSILAHGFTPVDPGVSERFGNLVRETFGMEESVEFPRFDL